MNILFINSDLEAQEEVDDYLRLHKCQAFFSKTTEQAIQALNNYDIELIILQIKTLRDAAILKYINVNYQHIEILLLASDEYDDIITVFSKCRYKLFRQSMPMEELMSNIYQLHNVRE